MSIHNIPCHTSIPITDDPRSPDYIEPPETHETIYIDISVSFEEILHECSNPSKEDIATYRLSGFEIDELYQALAKKMIATYGVEAIMEFEFEVHEICRTSVNAIAEELIAIWGDDIIRRDDTWGRNGLTIELEIERKIQ